VCVSADVQISADAQSHAQISAQIDFTDAQISADALTNVCGCVCVCVTCVSLPFSVGLWACWSLRLSLLSVLPNIYSCCFII
jgi:hypothetical protein